MTSVDGVGYTFDNNGNLLTTGPLTNTWDAANRLIETTRAGTTLQPSYDGLGNRVGQTVGLSTTYFALDVQGLPEVISTSAGNAYLHLPGVIVAENAIGEVRYLLSDGLGSVRQAVDESGTVVVYNEFDPYGNPILNSSFLISNYGYTGEWWEDEVGLLYLRARWYRPETGSFLSVDPVEGEPPYLYVRGNPINQIDPNGMEPPTPGPTPVPTPPPPPPPPQPTPPPRPVEGTPVPPGPIPPPVSTPPPFPTPISICPPLIFSAGGYAEGWSGSLTVLTIMTWQEGSEIVYDFATMERARFTYKGVPPERAQEDSPVKGVNISPFELATTWYAVNLNGFENEEDLNSDYSGRFTSFSLGVSTPGAEVGGGIVTVWSPGFDVTGIGHFQMAGVGPGGLGASEAWTFYSIAEPENDDLPIRYDTGGIVLQRDYERMRNDIVTGAHVPPHPNEDNPLFPRITMLRQQAALELDFVWSSYYAPLLYNYHSPMR